MHAQTNTHWIIVELALLLVGVPLLGVLFCALLLRRSRGELDLDRRQYQRLGFMATGYAFFQQLLTLAANFIPQRLQTWSVVGWLPILALTGVFAASVGAVLSLLQGRGVSRYGGVLLSLLAFGYSTLTILAFLSGGGF